MTRLEMKVPTGEEDRLFEFAENGVAGWWLRRRVLGVDTGLARGVLSLAPTADPLRAVQSCMDRFDSDLARITIVTPGQRASADRCLRVEAQGDLWRARMWEEIGDALWLGDDAEAFLACTGSHTRRNIRRAEKIGANHGLNFTFRRTSTYSMPDRDARRIALGNTPCPIPRRELRRYETILSRRKEQFESRMQTTAGELIHYCRGFIADDVAYVLYQGNDIKLTVINQSLLHRFKLIRALIGEGVRSLVFVSGCGGLLYQACETLGSEEWIAVRPTARATTRAAALAAAFPRSWSGAALRRLLVAGIRRRFDRPPLDVSGVKPDLRSAPAAERADEWSRCG